MQEVMDAQKRFVDTCQRVQLDDPTHVADVLDKLIDSLINKYVYELYCIMPANYKIEI